jgi:hypothetical protein
MGRISAILGLAVGVILLVAAFWPGGTPLNFSAHGVAYLGAIVLLITASYRTLRKMKGGLRLLAGMWGLFAGMLWAGFFVNLQVALDGNPDMLLQTWQLNALFAAAIASLAMTVLHKE